MPPRTEEHSHKIVVSRARNYDKWISNLSAAHKGLPSYERTPEHRAKLSEIAHQNMIDPKIQQRVSEGLKHMWQDPDKRESRLNSSARRKADRTHSEYMKAAWETNPEKYAGMFLSPNRIEQKVAKSIDELGWRFVGDGQIWIVGKNPDFIWDKGHKVLEVFGDYWHRNDDSQERINHFAKYNWPCLVVWEHEINDNLENVVSRIRAFM